MVPAAPRNRTILCVMADAPACFLARVAGFSGLLLKLTEEVGFSGRGLGLGAASRDVARPVASLCCLLHLLRPGACARWAGEVERGEDRDEQGGADNYLGEKPGSTRNALGNGSA